MKNTSSAPHQNLPRLTAQALLSLGLSATLVLGGAPLALAGSGDSNSSSTTEQSATSSDGTSSSSNSASSNGSQQTPPEKPSGDQGQPPSDGNGQPPSDGNGQPPSGQSGEKPDGEPPAKPDGEPGQGGPGGADTMTFDYSGTYSATLTADGEEATSSGKTIEATKTDVNAALAQNGGTLTISKATIAKSGSDTNGDNCNFYGVNSIVTAVGEKSTATITNSKLTSDSTGSNGVFATDNAKVTISKSSIATTEDNSRGLDATYGGSIDATDLTITTKGEHCAATATDRGGGTITVSDSKLTTKGSGSPLIYSTGSIQVTNVTGKAAGSQIAGMEGLNTISIADSTLESTATKATASDPVANGVIIYQSTSGDAESTTGSAATFTATNSSLKSAITEGSMFYVTNTNAIVTLENTDLDFDSSKAALLTAAGNDANNWGTAGSNGATVSFVAKGETLSGDASADTISSANLFLLDGTSYAGATSITENTAENAKTTDAPLTVNVSADSTWTVTSDSTVSNLHAEDGAKIVDEKGKTATIVANGKTVVQGEGSVTVTVNGTYDQTLDQVPSADQSSEDSSEEATSGQTSDQASDEGFFAQLWKGILSFFGLS